MNNLPVIGSVVWWKAGNGATRFGFFGGMDEETGLLWVKAHNGLVLVRLDSLL